MSSIFTSLCNIHHTSVLIHSHAKHLPDEELRVPGPAQVQLVQGATLQLVVMTEAGAALMLLMLLGADGPVEHHHEQD